MADVFCNDDGDASTPDGTSWSEAYTTLQAAITAAGSGGSVWLGHDHAETNSGSQTLTMPATTPDGSVRIVSCDTAQATPTYKKATAAQFSVTGTGNDITLTGSADFVGVYLSAHDDIIQGTAAYGVLRFTDCNLSYSSGTSGNITPATNATIEFQGTTITLNDSGSANQAIISSGDRSIVIARNLTISHANPTRRTGASACVIAAASSGYCVLEDCDASALTNLTAVMLKAASGKAYMYADGVKVPSGVPMFAASSAYDPIADQHTRCDATNFGIVSQNYWGITSSDTAYKRVGGASDGTSFSWKVVTGAKCRPGAPYYTPWIDVWVGTTGSKTFTVYIGNATADLTDTEAWLEVKYLGTSSSTVSTYATDRNTNVLATGTAQTDDTASDWEGDLTYMQSLAVGPVTVNKAGFARCRVGFSKASATVYVDPQVTVTAS